MFLMPGSIFEGELSDKIPVIHSSIAGCRIVGRLCAGSFGGCFGQTHVLGCFAPLFF
jgi:hypothetical protein